MIGSILYPYYNQNTTFGNDDTVEYVGIIQLNDFTDTVLYRYNCTKIWSLSLFQISFVSNIKLIPHNIRDGNDFPDCLIFSYG